MAQNLGSIQVELGLDKSKFSSGLSGAEREADGFSSRLEGKFSKMGSAIGSAFTTALTAAVVAGGAAITGSVLAYADFEKSLAGVRKTTGMTTEELNTLQGQILDLSETTGSSASDLAKLAEKLGAIGVSNKDIAATTKVANTAMLAYGTDAEKTANYFGTLLKIYGESTDSLEKYGSMLNVIEAKSRADPGYIMDFMDQMAPLAGMFEIAQDDAYAFAGAMADAGVQAGEAGTSIKSAILYALSGPGQKADPARIEELTKAYTSMGMAAADAKKKAKADAVTELGVGNERLSNWANLLGISVEDLTKQLNTDFMGTMAKSAKALNKYKDGTERAAKADQIWGTYGLKAMGTLAGAADNYSDYHQALVEDVISGSKSMSTEAATMTSTMLGEFDKLKAGITRTGIEIGQLTSGPLKDFMKYIADAVPKVRESLMQIFGGDVFGGLGNLGQVFQKSMDDAMKILRSAASAIGPTLAALFSPENLYQAFNRLGDFGGMLISQIQTGLAGLGKIDWGAKFDAVLSGITKSLMKIGEALIDMPWGSYATQAIGLLGSALQSAIRNSMDFARWLSEKLASIKSSDVSSAGYNIANALMKALGDAWKSFDIWQSLGTAFSLGGSALRILGDFASGIGKAILEKIDTSGIASKLTGAFQQAKTDISNIAGEIGKAFWDSIAWAINQIITSINSVSAKMSEMSRGAVNLGQMDTLSYQGHNVGGALVQAGQDLWNFGGYMMGDTNPTPAGGYGDKAMKDYYDSLIALGQGPTQAMEATARVYGKTLTNLPNDPLKMLLQGSNAVTTPTATNISATSSGLSGYGNSLLNALINGGRIPGTTGFGSTSGLGNGVFGLGTATAGAASAGGIAQNVTALQGQWTGGVVPVYVTNMGQGGMGGSGGSYAANYGYGAAKQFTGNVTPGGPGIGAVATSGEFQDVSISTCEIDQFGMTPGLGAYLAGAGVWKPIEGSATSEALASSIGYEGNYAMGGGNITPARAIGTVAKAIQQAQDKANKTQLNTAQQSGVITIDASRQSAAAQWSADQLSSQTQKLAGETWTAQNKAAADYALNNQMQVGAAWSNSIVQQAAATQSNVTAINTASTNVQTAGTGFQASTGLAGTAFGQYVNAAGDSIKLSGTDFKNSVNATLSSFSSSMNSLGSFFGGSPGGGGGSITIGGVTYTRQATSVSGGGIAPVWGGTSISGGGGWVGTGASLTGWGAAASNMVSGGMSSGSIGSFSWGKFAEGGIVTRPTVAIVGEAGEKEAIIPLSKAAEMGFGNNGMIQVNSTINVDGRRLAEVSGNALAKRLRNDAGLKVR